MTTPEEFDRQRRRIVRRVGLLTWGLLGGAVLLAIGGGALLAFLLRGTGLPFAWTWIVASVLLLGIPAVVHLVAKAVGRDPGEPHDHDLRE